MNIYDEIRKHASENKSFTARDVVTKIHISGLYLALKNMIADGELDMHQGKGVRRYSATYKLKDFNLSEVMEEANKVKRDQLEGIKAVYPGYFHKPNLAGAVAHKMPNDA